MHINIKLRLRWICPYTIKYRFTYDNGYVPLYYVTFNNDVSIAWVLNQ